MWGQAHRADSQVGVTSFRPTTSAFTACSSKGRAAKRAGLLMARRTTKGKLGGVSVVVVVGGEKVEVGYPA